MKRKVICEYIGGSHSYGLDSVDSDIDLRGVYLIEAPELLIDPYRYTSCATHCTAEDYTGARNDFVHYELRHMLHLLSRGNTQSIEMLFNNRWLKLTSTFEQVIKARNSLIDPLKMYHSVNGYSKAELSLGLGSRSGKLGSKRNSAVMKYGFSPKNFCNLFRILYCAETFYTTGLYPVNLIDSYIRPQLLEVKYHPDRFDLSRLTEMYEERLEAHEQAWCKYGTEVSRAYCFDPAVVTNLIYSSYKPLLKRYTRPSFVNKVLDIFSICPKA